MPPVEPSPYHLSKPIQIVPYDAGWPSIFADERSFLLTNLAPCVLQIEHFGSTSVPNLASKPIIDMLGAVADLAGVKKCRTILASLGYEDAATFLGYWHISDRFLFTKGPLNEGSHHLHLVAYDSPAWIANLNFRDFLRNHPAAAAEYAQLKETLAARHGSDVDGYTEGKTPFVMAAMASYAG